MKFYKFGKNRKNLVTLSCLSYFKSIIVENQQINNLCRKCSRIFKFREILVSFGLKSFANIGQFRKIAFREISVNIAHGEIRKF